MSGINRKTGSVAVAADDSTASKCLLFSTSDSLFLVENRATYCDLHIALNKHGKSTSHIQSQIALKTFGSSFYTH